MHKISQTLFICALSVMSATAQEEILIKEDFSGFTKGSVGAPDATELCSFGGSYDESHIDPSLTQKPGWFGCGIYQAGGTCYMKSPDDGETGAVLATPFGDYSGNLSVSFTAECPAGANTAIIYVALKHGDYEDCDADKTMWGYELSPGTKNTYTLSTVNRTASSEGFIQIFCLGEAYIHDVEVKASSDGVLGQPFPRTPEFTPTGIKFSWMPTRLAEKYRLSVSRMKWLADSDIDAVETFESLGSDGSGLPEGWNLESDGLTIVSNDKGKDGSKGLTLYSGDCLTLPLTNTRYTHSKFWYRVVSSDGTVDKVRDMKLTAEIFDGDKWIGVVQTNLDYVFEYEDGVSQDCIDDIIEGWLEKYYCVRLKVSGPSAKTYIVVDDIDYGYYRPGELETVKLNGSDYVDLTDLEYFMSYSDPTDEYYYSVKAVRGNDVSESKVYHALGLHAPYDCSHENLTTDGFTALFTPSAKSEHNQLTLMGITYFEKDQQRYPVIEESFDKIDSSVTDVDSYTEPEKLDNTNEIILDDYTAMPGWRGRSTAISQGRLGGYYDYENPAYLITPMFDLGKSDEFELVIKAYGSKGDELILRSAGGVTYRLPFTDIPDDASYGIHEGAYRVDSKGGLEQFTISTFNNWEFLIDTFELRRNVKLGEQQYTYIANYDLEGDATQCDLTLLPEYDGWAWRVISNYTSEGAKVYSLPTAWFETSENHVGVEVPVVPSIVKEVARYTIDGRRVNAPVQGVNIVVMSDGSVHKILEK